MINTLQSFQLLRVFHKKIFFSFRSLPSIVNIIILSYFDLHSYMLSERTEAISYIPLWSYRPLSRMEMNTISCAIYVTHICSVLRVILSHLLIGVLLLSHTTNTNNMAEINWVNACNIYIFHTGGFHSF